MSGRRETKLVVTQVPQFRAPQTRFNPSVRSGSSREYEEKFTSGSDGDWPIGKAPIDITSPRIAVARTIEEVGARNSRGVGIDVHEQLKKEMFGDVNDLCDNHFEKNRPCPDATYGISDQYMTLDSFEMIEESRPEKGVLKWNFMVQGVTGNQRIGIKDKMDTIIEMQIGSFNIPKPPTVPYVTNPTNGVTTLALPMLTTNGTPTVSAFIAPGSYASGALLATALQAAINAVPGISGFTVAYNSGTSLFTITDTVATISPFSILWGSGPNSATNAHVEFGFANVDLTGSSSYTGTIPVTTFPVVVTTGANDAFDFNVDGAPSTDPLTSSLTQLPFCNRVTIQMAEMGLQSYSDRFGARHHFEMEARPDFVQTSAGLVDEGTLILKPSCDWDTFIFTDPIKSVDGLTLIFRNPDIPLSLPPSCLFGVQAQIAATGQFLQFNAPNTLAAGDRIYITGFTSGNQVIDNYVNRQQGQVVGVGGLTANSFRLNPDVGTTLLGLPVGTPIQAPSSVFSLLWASGPNTATSSRALLGFNDADEVGNTFYSSDATFSLLWASGPNTATSARVALGFGPSNQRNMASYTGILQVTLLWFTGPNAATSIRQHLSIAAQNMQGGTKYSSGTFSILWGSGPSASQSCRSLFGFSSSNSIGYNTYVGSVQVASTALQNIPTGVINPLTGRLVPNFVEAPATYSVTSTNNKFDLYTGGPTITATITTGVYTTTELATALQAALAAVSDGFTVTYNASTSLFTVTRQGPFIVTTGVNDAFDFQVAGGPVQTAVVPAGSYTGPQFAAALQLATTTATPTSPFSDGFLVAFVPATNTFTISRGGGRFVIASGVNNAIDFNDGTALTALIPAGTYTGALLANATQAALNSVSYGFIVRYDPKLSRVTISRPTPVPENSMPVVVAGVNDSFDWMETSVKSIRLTAGTYSPVALGRLLENSMNAASIGYSVGYDSKAGRYTIARRHFPPTPQTLVCIAKNRIRIPLRLRRVVQRLTNYLAP